MMSRYSLAAWVVWSAAFISYAAVPRRCRRRSRSSLAKTRSRLIAHWSMGSNCGCLRKTSRPSRGLK